MRIFLFVINGLGVGSLPDYSKYEQEYFCTVDNLGCKDELLTFEKLGLSKCCLEQNHTATNGYFFRGRMLTINTTFESGLNEILGNVTFDSNVEIVENIISLAKKHGVNTCFSSSREGSIADVICANDDEQFGLAGNFGREGDSLFVAELNDFAKCGLLGDRKNMALLVKKYDEFIGRFMSKMQYDDVMFVTGNFGVTPSKIGITREYNPIFVFTKLSSGNKNLRTIQCNNAIAMTIADLLDIYPNSESLVDDKIRQKIQGFDAILRNEIVAAGMEKISKLGNKFSEEKRPVNDKEMKRVRRPKRGFGIRGEKNGRK